MTARPWVLFLLAFAMALAPILLAAEAQVNVPVGGGAAGIEGLKLVPTSGVTAKLQTVANTDGDRAALKIAFAKTGDERRLLVVSAPLHGNPAGAFAVALRCRLTLDKETPARLAVVLRDREGDAWYKIGSQAAGPGAFADGRLSLRSLQAAAFNDPAVKFDWAKIQTVWLGLVIDGPAQGSFEISDARFSSEPFHPPAPLHITGDPMAPWNVGNDPAVQYQTAIANEGPDGKPCARTAFVFPLGRHMYMLPSTPLPAADLEGYTALRFSYKAVLPEGIKGLLVTLWERGGGQYEEQNYPPPSAEWTTVTLPFDSFHVAGWSKDDNNHFDTEDISTVMIGVHGAASGGDGKGTIWVTDVELVP
jgi:hypothetical protein